ncbi:hypothetical protein MPSEU_000638400 [Mayamaea pseudoterrestris]|nr:hypothetical protein MPSEU_000638400 [Mayamaea pseudoterrestris]
MKALLKAAKHSMPSRQNRHAELQEAPAQHQQEQELHGRKVKHQQSKRKDDSSESLSLTRDGTTLTLSLQQHNDRDVSGTPTPFDEDDDEHDNNDDTASSPTTMVESLVFSTFNSEHKSRLPHPDAALIRLAESRHASPLRAVSSVSSTGSSSFQMLDVDGSIARRRRRRSGALMNLATIERLHSSADPYTIKREENIVRQQHPAEQQRHQDTHIHNLNLPNPHQQPLSETQHGNVDQSVPYYQPGPTMRTLQQPRTLTQFFREREQHVDNTSDELVNMKMFVETLRQAETSEDKHGVGGRRTTCLPSTQTQPLTHQQPRDHLLLPTYATLEQQKAGNQRHHQQTTQLRSIYLYEEKKEADLGDGNIARPTPRKDSVVGRSRQCYNDQQQDQCMHKLSPEDHRSGHAHELESDFEQLHKISQQYRRFDPQKPRPALPSQCLIANQREHNDCTPLQQYQQQGQRLSTDDQAAESRRFDGLQMSETRVAYQQDQHDRTSSLQALQNVESQFSGIRPSEQLMRESENRAYKTSQQHEQLEQFVNHPSPATSLSNQSKRLALVHAPINRSTSLTSNQSRITDTIDEISPADRSPRWSSFSSSLVSPNMRSKAVEEGPMRAKLHRHTIASTTEPSGIPVQWSRNISDDELREDSKLNVDPRTISRADEIGKTAEPENAGANERRAKPSERHRRKSQSILRAHDYEHVSYDLTGCKNGLPKVLWKLFRDCADIEDNLSEASEEFFVEQTSFIEAQFESGDNIGTRPGHVPFGHGPQILAKNSTHLAGVNSQTTAKS